MFIYNRGAAILQGAGNFLSDVFYAILERSTSTYSPNRDHDYMSDLTGFVEITVASYVRILLTTPVINVNDSADRAELDCDDLAFGTLETGQTVKAVLIYRQTGGDDSSPTDDELISYYDGKIDVTLAANASSGAATVYVEPLIGPLPAATVVNFGGGATGTLAAGAAIGARSLNLTGGTLAAGASAGAISAGLSITGNILPFALGGGAFNGIIDAAGLIQAKPR